METNSERPGPDMVRVHGDGSPMTAEEQAIEEENDLRFGGKIDATRYRKRQTDNPLPSPWSVGHSTPNDGIGDLSQRVNTLRHDVAYLRQEVESVEELRSDLRQMVDTVAHKSSGLRFPAAVVAKAVLFQALGWCIVVADKGRKLARKIIAATSHVIYEATKDPPPIYIPSTRDSDFPLGPLSGKQGDIKEIVIEPEMPFRIEKIMAADEGTGYDTAIQRVVVGGKEQRPGSGGSTLTLFYAHNALGNGMKTDWCRVGQKIRIWVEFRRDSTFNGVLWGKAIADEKALRLDLDEVLP